MRLHAIFGTHAVGIDITTSISFCKVALT